MTNYEEAERDQFQHKTDELDRIFDEEGVGRPLVMAFHGDVEFILRRAASSTPPAYERFLRYVTTVFSGMVLIAIPGLTGFISTALVIYVLGGMYVVIDDMDRPMEAGEDSLIWASLAPLKNFNQGFVA